MNDAVREVTGHRGIWIDGWMMDGWIDGFREDGWIYRWRDR